MPTEKKVTLYRYDELSEHAKEKAREWYLSGLYWPEELQFVLDHWRAIADQLGFYVDNGPWWDLDRNTFCIGRGRFYRTLDSELDALEKEYAHNPDVLSIVREVRAIHWNFSASLEDGKIASFDLPADYEIAPQNDDEEEWDNYYEQLKKFAEESFERLKDALSDLQKLGLKWLQKEAEYIESEAAIEEVMKANEWLFFEDGSFAE